MYFWYNRIPVFGQKCINSKKSSAECQRVLSSVKQEPYVFKIHWPHPYKAACAILMRQESSHLWRDSEKQVNMRVKKMDCTLSPTLSLSIRVLQHGELPPLIVCM